jgi:hypothetical protein
MSLEQAKTRFDSLLRTIGRSTLATLFPDDFEVYITALELVDSQEKTVDYFLFPLNPTSISESENQIVNIKKTAGGISAISTETYMPSIINLSGNFGRKFKILVGNNIVDFKAFVFSETNFNKAAKTFDDTAKTGYGCIKVLEKIIKKSNQLDQNGQPYFLYLYNLNFGKVYLVKCIGQPTFSSSVDQNMIWNYNIQFQTLAKLSQITSKNEKNSNLKLLGISTIQKGLNAVMGSVLTTSTRS